MANLPLGIVKAHSLELTVARRYRNGLSANFAFSANTVTENRVVEAYDREPTLWQPSQDSRPCRMSGGAVYELPFGGNKTFLKEGVASKIVGGWQLGGTFEYQPGALQFRLDVQNLLDSVLWSNPDMNPTSTNFGKVTGATNSIMRFFTFVWKVNF